MKVLGIETSCDESAIAIYDAKEGILAHSIHSQIDIHTEYGGVVPELASRDHIRKTTPLIQTVLNDSGLQSGDIDGIAYTCGPGLIGALFVGTAIGRTLAWAWNIPAVGIHHLEGHLLAPMLEKPAPEFPFLALLVSGGHTMLVHVKNMSDYHILGETLDDAAGEAFDKTAKMLQLGYPGGPQIAKLAQHGNPQRFKFPRPMTNRPGLDFSFSGLKTFAMNTKHAEDDSEQTHADIAWAFQDAVIDTLAIKCRRAIKQTGLKRLVVAGGVGANQELREKLKTLMQQQGGDVFFPKPEYCTDNGAMIAYAGYLRLKAGQTSSMAFQAKSRWPIDSLNLS